MRSIYITPFIANWDVKGPKKWKFIRAHELAISSVRGVRISRKGYFEIFM